eukprot:1160727-Pelagomonas_calceolata.AAC.1
MSVQRGGQATCNELVCIHYYLFLWAEQLLAPKQWKVYADQRPRALRECPLTGKPEASPESPLNLH